MDTNEDGMKNEVAAERLGETKNRYCTGNRIDWMETNVTGLSYTMVWMAAASKWAVHSYRLLH